MEQENSVSNQSNNLTNSFYLSGIPFKSVTPDWTGKVKSFPADCPKNPHPVDQYLQGLENKR